MSNDPIIYEERDSIGYLVLNNPPKNEMNNNFFSSLTDIVNDIISGINIRGIIIHGKGRHFSSGANVNELKTVLNRDNTDFLYKNIDNFIEIEKMNMPIVAAIGGCCFGLGLELALVCQYRIAAEKAVFSMPEITFGLIPGCGGTVRLPGLIGKRKAMEMILTGRSMLADEAKEYGLVDLVVNRKDLLKKAEDLILKISCHQYSELYSNKGNGF